jgi:uncharacterized membrane protein YbhN (UPF0104 family)
LGRFFAGYGWLILKNLVGWTFIFASPLLGFTLPGPGGIPLFLIGFALVTFPGKRKLTARVLRGRKMDLEGPVFDVLEIVISLLLPLIVLWPLAISYWPKQKLSLTTAWYIAVCICAVATTWIITRWALRGINLLIAWMPLVRRKVRPWLRRHGINLLPPRYLKRRGPRPSVSAESGAEINDEILEIHERHLARAKQYWLRSLPWIKRVLGIAITFWIFAIMIRPLAARWPDVRDQIRAINWPSFLLACAMFSVFLFLFRAVTWRKVLKGFGYRLPYAASTRIWSTSELARYLPGAIWQVVGRVYLIRPYGVDAVVCSTSQILELCMFVFANVLLAGSCLLWFAAKIDPEARPWLMIALALVPALAVLLHPKIFYGITNFALQKFIGRPPIVRRLRGLRLVELLAWVLLGLFWQSAAVYLIAAGPLHLKIDWWWMIAAAYCLAWTAGFFAFWAPGGIGVRELVFALTMQLVIPDSIRHQYFPDDSSFRAMLFFLGFLLRLWTLIGELTVWMIASVIDFRGAMNRADAPGRPAPIQQSAGVT